MERALGLNEGQLEHVRRPEGNGWYGVRHYFDPRDEAQYPVAYAFIRSQTESFQRVFHWELTTPSEPEAIDDGTSETLGAPRVEPRSRHTRYYPAARPAEHSNGPSLLSFERDPAELERALSGHADTQDALAKYLRQRRLEPLSPKGQVKYDLAWHTPHGLAIAEIKSITHLNEAAQLRSGMGQLLDYAAQLTHLGEDVADLFLVAEREPLEPDRWLRACERAGIHFVCGPAFTGVE